VGRHRHGVASSAQYARRGIGLVEPDDGVDALRRELAAVDGPPQVIVMRAQPRAMAPDLTAPEGTLAEAGQAS
jgi:hypothetical protein